MSHTIKQYHSPLYKQKRKTIMHYEPKVTTNGSNYEPKVFEPLGEKIMNYELK